jgi:UDPglucose 6-dehydrogenase
VGELSGKTIAILGLHLSRKPTICAKRLLSYREHVGRSRREGRAYDPVAMEEAGKVLSKSNTPPTSTEAVAGADALVFITEWNQFRALDMARIRDLMRITKNCRPP